MAFKSLLEWWQQAGVDILTQDIPQNWFSKNHPENSLFKPSDNKNIRENNFSKNNLLNFKKNEEILSAPSLIKNIPQNISSFQLWLQNIFGEKCLFSEVKISPKLMVLSESPEAEDMAQGQLFSGKAGRLLHAMLDTLCIKKQDIYFATMSPIVEHIDYVKISSYAAGNSLTSHDYTLIAAQHISLIKPRYLHLLGDAPNRALLQMNTMDARKKIHAITVNNDNIDAFALLHPKMLLETPPLKAIAWKDLRVLKGKIDEKTTADE
uniref:DNA polymerse n=1 Tax=Zymomonas mobilis TaxID=542 RepID=Q9X3W8_ZYMMB|nr:DNA polymerse [Zymomonas mobilis subsp. mobilis ZM4 = ATCC 31821]